MNVRSTGFASTIPFDTRKLDDLLEQAGIDVLIATSKHNVGYLLGGYRSFFFETMDAANRYAILYRVQTAKKPETRAERIERFVGMCARHETIHPSRKKKELKEVNTKLKKPPRRTK